MPDVFDFSHFPRLETPRLVLREITPRDAPAVFRIRGDYEVTKYNTGAAYQNVQQAVKLIDNIGKRYNSHEELRWGIQLKTHHDLIGICGFNYWDRTDNRASVGYDLLRSEWGNGYMPETLRAVIAFGFTHMGLNRIEADTSAENSASMRVLEKVGFQREGVQREQYYEHGRYYDLVLFALLKRDYAHDATMVNYER